MYPKMHKKKVTIPTAIEDLNNKYNELTAAINLSDVAPSIENHTASKQANAKFIKTINEARRRSSMKNTQ